MENILQSLVKIIIIGALYEGTYVDCNRPFLPPPPPLPYYQNDDYYVSGFAPTFRNQVPTYYSERNLPNPTSFQNIKSYTPPRLFYQNENYIPPPLATPALSYPLPHLFPYKQGFHQPQQPLKPQQKLNFVFSRVQYKNLPHAQPARPQQVPQKKTEAFASNIIVKEEPLSPYYSDDYSKNYNDEDYTDNYSDDSSAPLKPCVASTPYRYFEAPKGAPNSDDKYTLCNPYFQPNLGSSVYTLKVPITLLPSRFPPRIEQLIERIQNYFSTYTQQQTLKPQNETFPSSSTSSSVVETSTESSPQPSTAGEVHEGNKTEEYQQETGSSTTTVEDFEQSTQKTVVAKDPHVAATTAQNAQVKDVSQTEAPTTRKVDVVAESAPDVVTEDAQTVAGTTTESNQPVEGPSLPGEEKPQSTLPEELQSVTTSTSAEDLKGSNNTDPQTEGSFQVTDSSNG